MPVTNKYINVELCWKMKKSNNIHFRQKRRKVFAVADTTLSAQNLTKMIGLISTLAGPFLIIKLDNMKCIGNKITYVSITVQILWQ